MRALLPAPAQRRTYAPPPPPTHTHTHTHTHHQAAQEVAQTQVAHPDGEWVRKDVLDSLMSDWAHAAELAADKTSLQLELQALRSELALAHEVARAAEASLLAAGDAVELRKGRANAHAQATAGVRSRHSTHVGDAQRELASELDNNTEDGGCDSDEDMACMDMAERARLFSLRFGPCIIC